MHRSRIAVLVVAVAIVGPDLFFVHAGDLSRNGIGDFSSLGPKTSSNVGSLAPALENDLIFLDGFESGDTSLWSATVPECVEDLDCDDGNVCTADSCNPSTGCEYAPQSEGTSCSNACMLNGSCVSGQCRGEPVLCDDGNLCTADSCDPLLGCSSTAVTNPYAVAFDSSCASFPDLMGTLELNDQLTIEFWYQADTGWPNNTILDKRWGSDVFSGVEIDADCCELTYNEAGLNFLGPSLDQGTWHHVAFVRNLGQLFVFWDGVFVDDDAGWPSTVANDSTVLHLGCEFDETSGRYEDFLLNGRVDELRISNIARYSSFQSFTPNVRYEPDAFTLGLYHFDSDTPPTYIEDSSSHGNHGAWVFGTPLYVSSDSLLCP